MTLILCISRKDKERVVPSAAPLMAVRTPAPRQAEPWPEASTTGEGLKSRASHTDMPPAVSGTQDQFYLCDKINVLSVGDKAVVCDYISSND